MSINFFVSVTFEADSNEEGRAAVESMNLPQGAIVNISSSEVLASGVVDENGAIAPQQPTAVEMAPGALDNLDEAPDETN